VGCPFRGQALGLKSGHPERRANEVRSFERV
jgi:hypothetical protein